MSKTLILEIPDEIFETVQDAAAQSGASAEKFVVEIVVQKFAPQIERLKTAKPPTGGIRELFGKGHSGDARAADNEKIDTDLAGEYGATHEDA